MLLVINYFILFAINTFCINNNNNFTSLLIIIFYKAILFIGLKLFSFSN